MDWLAAELLSTFLVLYTFLPAALYTFLTISLIEPVGIDRIMAVTEGNQEGDTGHVGLCSCLACLSLSGMVWLHI